MTEHHVGPHPNPDASRLPPRVAVALRVVVALWLFLTALAFGGFVASAAVDQLRQSGLEIQLIGQRWTVITLGLGVLVASIQELALSLPRYWHFVAGRQRPQIYPEGVHVMLGALSLGLCLYGWRLPDASESRPASEYAFVQQRQDPHEALAIPMVRFGLARLAKDKQSFESGVNLGGDVSWLTEFVRGLAAHCAPGNADRIEVGVQAFASDRGFRGLSEIESAHANKTAADLRAQSLYRALVSELESTGLQQKIAAQPPSPWKSHDEMRNAREDALKNQAAYDTDDFHRIAILRLIETGICRVDNLSLAHLGVIQPP